MNSNSTDPIEEFKSQIIFRLKENTPRIQKCLDLLSEDQIWFQANGETNSIANLILHLSGNIGQYLISSLGEEKDFRNRDLEFSTREGFSKKTLFNKISETCERAILAIENCRPEHFTKSRNVQGFELTGIGICIHAAEHYSYHTGQIALLTKLMLEKDLGFYSDLDLNQKNK